MASDRLVLDSSYALELVLPTHASWQAIREGRTWDASFACPAGRFVGSLFQSSSFQSSADSQAPYGQSAISK